MAYNHNECYKNKFNQCYPINPSIKNWLGPYMVYACTALIALNKTQRYRLELIQNYCLRYARKAADSTCISNDEICSRCNILSVEQRVLALANNWWQKASGNKDGIAKQIPPQTPL